MADAFLDAVVVEVGGGVVLFGAGEVEEEEVWR